MLACLWRSSRLGRLDLTGLARALLAIVAAALCIVLLCVMEFGESEDRFAMVLLMPLLLGGPYACTRFWAVTSTNPTVTHVSSPFKGWKR